MQSTAVNGKTRKFIGGTVEELPLEPEEIHDGKPDARERTYRGRSELKRCPVVSYGGEVAALWQEWRGVAVCVGSGVRAVANGALWAPACVGGGAMARRRDREGKKRFEAGRTYL